MSFKRRDGLEMTKKKKKNLKKTVKFFFFFPAKINIKGDIWEIKGKKKIFFFKLLITFL